MNITLRNEFHDTSCTVQPAPDGTLSGYQVERARRKLCGVSGCVCGGIAGTRGNQWTWHGDRALMVHLEQLGPRDADGARIVLVDDDLREYAPGDLG